MTIQASEILTFNRKTYYLQEEPLEPFLKKNKKVQFEMYTTAHWRGYQGYWLLKDDRLFLKRLQSNNYTFEDLFQRKGPVLAEWYSGTLYAGFGKSHFGGWCIVYEKYLQLKIKRGHVLEFEIVDEMPGSSKL